MAKLNDNFFFFICDFEDKILIFFFGNYLSNERVGFISRLKSVREGEGRILHFQLFLVKYIFTIFVRSFMINSSFNKWD